jgi:hypothetical protein
LGDDAPHALAAVIADGAGDRVAVNDLYAHERPDAVEINMLVLASNAAVPRISLHLLATLIRSTTKARLEQHKGKP